MPEGQCPFMCSQTRCVRLGLQRPMSFIQQGQKIDKDEIKYHDIFSMFLVKQKIKQAQFYCQNVNLCTALGKADSGTHRRSGLMLLLAVPSFLLEILTELLPNQRGNILHREDVGEGMEFYTKEESKNSSSHLVAD